MKIGYLGPENSFTHTAAASAFSLDKLISYPSIPACIKAVEYGDVHLSVVPIENTIEGSVNTTLDYLFHQATISVSAEIVLPIQQQLLVAKENQNDWLEIKKVLSHPQALAQCEHFIQKYLPNALMEPVPSTTYGANYVKEHPQAKVATIASKEAANKYQLEIVAENIQDLEINHTRFWVLGQNPVSLSLTKEQQKLSIAITLPNNMPGSLHKALAAFGWREISLSKIESRPLKTSLGEYFFLIDIQVHKTITLIENALEEIRLLGGTIKIFGHYDVYPIMGI